MTRVVVTDAAARSLAGLIDSHSLPTDTRERIRRSLRRLERFPRLGPVLDPASPDLRFLLGPWRWLIIVYAYREADDMVAVVAFEDGRSARSATSQRHERIRRSAAACSEAIREHRESTFGAGALPWPRSRAVLVPPSGA